MDEINKNLLKVIEDIEPEVVLLSGGVDSSLVAAACARTRTSCRYIFFDTPFATQTDKDTVKAVAGAIGISVDSVKTSEDYWDKVEDNPRNRCYLCKSHLYTLVDNDKTIVDGTTAEDMASTDRPGLRANKEFLIRSPLAVAGMNKKTIRSLAKLWGLPVWNRPSQSCLATRFEFGSRINVSILPRIEELESHLQREFDCCRARHSSDMLVIELCEKDFIRGLKKRNDIIDLARACGFSQPVSLDFTGIVPV